MSSFWYLDGFGILSEHNHKTFCRQTLIGGNYGLLNTTTFEPNPDYYALLLWQHLMGINVFNVNVSIENYNRQNDKEVSSYLRAYAHCTNTGSNNNAVIGKQEPGLTILLINLSNETEFFVNISDYMYHERIEYVMDSTDLHSQSVYLNNKLLKTNALNGDIPNMDGKVVKPLKTIINGARNSLNDNDVIKTATDNLIHLKPSSYGFFTFPTLDVEHCR
jgi:heparanase